MFALGASAQQHTYKGSVVSAENGEPLIGATVMGVGTGIGVTSDIDGNFVISLPESVKMLRISYVGMKPAEVPVSSSPITVSLEEASTLQEVVVTGYGTVSKKAFTGASASVNGKEIEKKADVNFVKGLEGNVTGFTYNNSTASPGTWGSVTVRGLGTLSSGSSPLYVIDGVPVSSTPEYMSEDTNNYFDPMAAYSPSDIESVTVLKDAAATSIYGSRAANGVIVITTKKGSARKFEVNIDVKQGLVQVANNNMKYADAFGTMDLFARGYAARTGASYEEARAAMVDNFGWDGKTNTDWVDAVTRKGHFQEYNINFNGTSGDTHYYAALNYNDAKGIVINSDNKRYSGRVNLDSKYQWLSAGVNASYSYSLNNNFSQATTGSMSSPLTGAVSSMLPFFPVYNPDGSYWGQGIEYNPVAINDKDLGDMNQITNRTFVGNPWMRLDLPYGFWIKTNFGVNIVNQSEYSYWSAITNPQGIDYNGLGQKYDTNQSTLTWTNTIGWDHTYGDKHAINVLLGQEMQRYEYSYDYMAKGDFPFADLGMRDLTTAGSEMGIEYYKEQSRLASYFLDARYAFDNRYFISASYRRDGSSVFGANKRWGNFWSVGAKWRLVAEPFMQDYHWLTNADVRISYGTVGNQSIPLYAARGFYAAGYNYAHTPGMVPAQIANPDLTWETSRKFDVGFDFGVFNRANLVFDFYSEDTSDALFEVPVSRVTGQESVYKNVGKIRNIGVELGANAVVFTNDKLTVNAFVNMSWNKNKILRLADGDIEGTYTIRREGRPYRQWYMPEYAGVNPENGKPLYYKNETGDETTENFSEASKRYMGQADPKFFGAFGVNATGWGFDFSIQFNYRAGNKVYDTGHRFTGWGMSLMTPLQTVVDNSWTPENKNALYPQYIYGDPDGSTTTYSSRWLMDGDFVRLSNITLGYTLPKKITQKALMQKVRFYMIFDNVWTWTHSNFVGYNPETYASGVIAWQYPSQFSFTGGVQITF